MSRTYSNLLYRSRLALRSRVVKMALERSPRFAVFLRRVRSALEQRVFADRPVWLTVQAGGARGAELLLRLPSESVYWAGTHEPEVQTAIAAGLAPGDTAYDVGAHAGLFTACMALRVASAGRVVAFDGDPENAARLRRSVERNRWQDRVEVVEAAVWSRSADRIGYRRGNLARSQGGVEDGDYRPVLGTGELSAVRAIALDDYVAAMRQAPKLIKIDVEGGEAAVLAGAIATARQHRPLFIVEVHHAVAVEAAERWMREVDYAGEWLIPPEQFPRRLMARPQTLPSR